MNRSTVSLFLAFLLILTFGSGIAQSQHFEFAQTDANMSVLILGATLNGESLVENDEIGVFTPGGLCAGASVVTGDGFPVGVAAWGAEQGQQNGFAANQAIAYRFWDNANRREVNVGNVEVAQGQNIYVAFGFAAVRLAAEAEDMNPVFAYDPISIELEVWVGSPETYPINVWNDGNATLEVNVAVVGEAFYLEGDDFLQIEPENEANVVIVFDPPRRGDFEGEVIFSTNDPNNREVSVSLICHGLADDEEFPELAFEGINFGEVLVNEEAVEMLRLHNVGDADLVVEDIVVEGDGFFAEWQGGGGGGDFYWEYAQTDANMSLLIQSAEIGGESLVPGDFIGVFTPGGLCAGFSEVTDEGFPVGVAAWGAEQGLSNGFRDAEQISFRLWDSEAGTEWTASYEMAVGEALYAAFGFAVARLYGDEQLGEDNGGLVIAPDDFFDIPVHFTPFLAIEYHGSVAVVSNDPRGVLNADLFGIGYEEQVEEFPNISLSTNEIDFGEVNVDETGESWLTISNTGNAPLVINNVVVNGDGFAADWESGGGEFYWDYGITDANMSIIIQSAEIEGESLVEGDYVGVFTPAGLCAGMSPVTADGFPIGVSAWGAEQNMNNGFRADEPIEFRLWDASANVEWIAEAEMINGQARYAAFSFAVAGLYGVDRIGGGGNGQEIVLEPDESFDLWVGFMPTAAGEYHGTLIIDSNDPDGPVDVHLMGVGVETENPTIMVSEAEFDFGPVLYGDYADWTLTVSNVGGSQLVVDEVYIWSGDAFEVLDGSGFTLGAEESHDVMVRFTPFERGEFEGLLMIVSNDPDNHQFGVTLYGTGIAPVIGFSADVLDFGNVYIGEENVMELAVRNDGDAVLEITDAWTSHEDFSVMFEEVVNEFDWRFTASDNNMSVLITEATLNGESLVEGDAIGAFTGEGICSGYSFVTDEGFPIGVAVWGDEAGGEVTGFGDGEELNFRVWDNNSRREYIAAPNVIQGNLEYHSFAFTVLTLEAGGLGRDLDEPIVLGPGEAVMAWVSFHPNESAEYMDYLYFNSNDPFNAEAVVELFGVGMQRNRAPEWVEFPEYVEGWEANAFEFMVFAFDADEDELVITFDDLDGTLPEAAQFTDNGDGSGTFNWEPTYDEAGTYHVRFTASDGQVSAFALTTIEVFNVNRAPMWVQEPPEYIEMNEGEVLEGLLFAGDPDGDDVHYYIAYANLPEHVVFEDWGDGTAYFYWDISFDDAGEYVVGIGVTDGDLSIEAEIQIVINNVNRALEWAEVPEGFYESAEGETLELMFVAVDPDNDFIEYSMDGDLPENAMLHNWGEGQGHFIWDISYQDGGWYFATFYATDGEFTVEWAIEFSVLQTPYYFVDYSITDVNHSVIINEVDFEGESIPTGWEIGVFTPGGILAGGGMWFDGEQLGLSAWGDDAGTEPVEGFRFGERMTFKLWDDMEEREYETSAIVIQGSVMWQPNGFSVLNLTSAVSREQVVALRDGWNIISVNITPDQSFWREGENRGPDIVRMLAQLRDEENHHRVVIIKNDLGRFYAPQIPFDNLRYWDLNEGYYMRVEGEGSLRYNGTPIPADADIVINEGWNYIPYYPTYDLDASRPDYYVLSPIIDYVIIAKNTLGRFMAPGSNFSNMPPWTPGQGYQVRLSRSVTFNYPAEEQRQASVVSREETRRGYWVEPTSTGADMSVLVMSISDYNVQEGDQIAAFTTDGRLVGVGEVNEFGQCGLAVWGDDPTTEKVDGLLKGEAFTLRLYDSRRNAELSLSADVFRSATGLEYETDAFTVLEASVLPEVPKEYYLSDAFPNPFNSAARLSYGLPESGNVSIRVFDLSGRVVATLVEGEMTAGNHTVVWEGVSAGSGVYLVKMEAPGFSASRKVIMVK